jgi:hypothetical protein
VADHQQEANQGSVDLSEEEQPQLFARLAQFVYANQYATSEDVSVGQGAPSVYEACK